MDIIPATPPNEDDEVPDTPERIIEETPPCSDDEEN